MGIKPECFAFKGNALQVFHRMSLDDSGDYELLKVALLNRYRLTDADAGTSLGKRSHKMARASVNSESGFRDI